MDSREGIGTPARLAPGQVVELPVVGVGRIPSSATAVALNVTGILLRRRSFITASRAAHYRPTSSLNPAAGKVTPNLVMAQVSPAGTVCFFASTDIDLVVDVVGYVSTSAIQQVHPQCSVPVHRHP